MNGLIRRIASFTAFGLLVAVATRAGVPSPGNTTAPSFITLVGSTVAGVPDTVEGVFVVTARDLANNPIAGSPVDIDLSGCGDLRLCADQLNVNYTLNCATKTVRAYTDNNGLVRFTILGASNNGPPSSHANCGKVYLDGVLIKSPTIAAPDLDGAIGLGANDLSKWFEDFGTLEYWGRSDYDGSGGPALGANDLSIWIRYFGGQRSTSSCASYCP